MPQRFLALLFLLALAAPAVAMAAPQEASATTWDEALALSREHGQPILIDFFTEW